MHMTVTQLHYHSDGIDFNVFNGRALEEIDKKIQIL